MPVTRICLNESGDNSEILNISDSEAIALKRKIRKAAEKGKKFGIKQFREFSDGSKMPKSRKMWQLVFLAKHQGELVSKAVLSEFIKMKHPNSKPDQQERHLSTQCGWYVLNKGEAIPGTDERIPSGFHMLVNLDQPHPAFAAQKEKRNAVMTAKEFSDIKKAYGMKCATCGIEEGAPDPRNGEIVKLQQGHMHPDRKLEAGNIIPQCSYCNRTSKDYFIYDENGRVDAVYNPEFVLRSPDRKKDEMIRILLEDARKRNSLPDLGAFGFIAADPLSDG